MTRVLVAGATGKLGTPIATAIGAADELVLAARVARSLPDADGGFATIAEAFEASSIDVLLDATVAASGGVHAIQACAARVPVVLGATGIPAGEMRQIAEAAERGGVPVLHVPNFSIGAVLMMRFAAEAARHLPDCAIIEEHHPAKRDAPSGTALRTADLVEDSTGARPPISSIRLEGVVANQSVLFGGVAQTLEIRNVTTSREAFVPGALLAVRHVKTLSPGLHVGLEQVLDIA